MFMRYLVLFFPLISLISCSPREPHEQGKILATKYCGSCHLAVSPALLDKDTWVKHVLPAMAPKLGIGVWHGDQYYPGSQKGAVTFEEWTEITNYYKTLAPDKLTVTTKPLQEDSTTFSIQRPVWEASATATTTLVSMHNGSIYSSQSENPDLLKWDQQLKPAPFMKLESAAVDMNWETNDTALLTCIGHLRAIDAPKGTLWKVMPGAKEEERIQTIGLGLPRPVQSVGADFNKDGQMDYLVCGFGHNYGGLYIFQKTEDDYKKLPVWEVPGAIHAEIKDVNNDGWPDIVALFAYADEGIWLFMNDHKGGFQSKNILRFPPVYGSTSFQLVDWNKDGLPDIVYTAGDNADYSMILKPYHGVYIFINKGDFKYEQAYFYPINGCTKAIAADFDNDGDLDIATVAFFADLQHNPSEKFIFLEQTKNLQFTAKTVKNLTGEGRWICMDAGDFDNDGDTDIVLGNYSRGFIIQDDLKPDWNTSQPIILLKNNTIFKKSVVR
jgi:hypothetical protein